MSEALDPDTAIEYLRERPETSIERGASAEALGGGVSNSVIRVRSDTGCVVLKQPFPDLAVESDWPADIERVHNEAAAAHAYADILDRAKAKDGAPTAPESGAEADEGIEHARVPGVVFEDHEDHVIGIECAPESATMWKRELLDGEVDERIAKLVGRVLGTVHAEAAGDEALRESFANKRPFDQLRIDPYHRTVARRHPEVADAIEAEIERVRGVERTLVHGDYSPKNVLVEYSRGTGESDNDEKNDGDAFEAWLLDFEVAHWGDPAFDTAFMCNHLFIKSIYNYKHGEEYANAALAFWEAYCEYATWNIERETVAELAVLMLARVDGKSPVEYVNEGPVAEALRGAAKRALETDPETLMEFAAIVEKERETL